jgi:hypothetical protein
MGDASHVSERLKQQIRAMASDPVMTALAAKLGLENPAVYLLKQNGERPEGLTTAMLLQALRAVMNGDDVAIRADSDHYARQLWTQLQEWMEKLGVDVLPGKSIMYGCISRPLADFTEGARYFTDHYRRPSQ